MIINGQILTPDIWEEIKDLEITEALDHLYKRGFFGDLAPTHDENGQPYNSIFETGVRFDFNLFQIFDYGDEIRQLELLMKLKYKYDRPYGEQVRKLEDINEKLRILNALHE